jgi:hypothetical protein
MRRTRIAGIGHRLTVEFKTSRAALAASHVSKRDRQCRDRQMPPEATNGRARARPSRAASTAATASLPLSTFSPFRKVRQSVLDVAAFVCPVEGIP